MSVQRRRRRGWLAVVAGGLVLLTTGCSIGDIRRPVPTRPPAPAPTSPGGPHEVRESRVPVPADYVQQQVEFGDRQRGYALFTRCGAEPAASPAPSECSAILLGTMDGGRSWRQLRQPRPVAREYRIRTWAGGVLLFAEPYGWYRSFDQGDSFTHVSATADLRPLYPGSLFYRFEVDAETGRLVDREAEPPGPVPRQPPLPNVSAVTYTPGRPLMAAGVQGGRPYAAVSPDEGRTWRQTPVPAQDGQLTAVRLEQSIERDIWLLGYAADRTRFPRLWRYATDHWEAVSAIGHPERISDVEPIGIGMLVVIGPNGSGVVTVGRYDDVGWPLGGDEIDVLSDSTLFSVHPDGSVWLGIGHEVERKWIKIVLTRM